MRAKSNKVAAEELVHALHMNNNSSKPPMSVHEFAQALGVCDRTVFRLIEKGEVRAFRVGKALRILSGEVERYIDSHMVATDEKA